MSTALAVPGDGWEPDDAEGFPGFIGPIWVKRQPGLRYGLRVARQHLNRDGAVHGGLYLTLFDHALGFLAFEAAKVARLVTIQLGVHFIAGATEGEFLELKSEVVRQTGSYLFMRGLCYSDGRLLASSDGIWKKFNA